MRTWQHFQLCMARIASVTIFVIHACLLVAFHVKAEYNENEASSFSSPSRPGFIERLTHFPDGLTREDLVLLGALVTLAFEFLDYCCKRSGGSYTADAFHHKLFPFIVALTISQLLSLLVWLGSERIPVRGKHLDVLSSKDLLFIGFSKANTAPFTYFYFRYVCSSKMPWSLRQIGLSNTLLPLVILFVLFDFVYTILHWTLHIPSIYGYIHKHHHHQKAPSRAAVDAINVHPIEYILGEYNHLLALWFCQTYLVSVHAIATVLFLAIGGSLAAINHTRYDIVLSLGRNFVIYDSKVHDVHHRIPQSNYGQYTMFWDRVFGTFRYVYLLC